MRKLSINPLIAAGLAVIFLSNSAPAQHKTWRLVWSDEFNGPGSSDIDQKKWTAEIGGQGWGNQELEYYTRDPKNLYLDGQGFLVIKALREKFPAEFECWYGGCQYSSARIMTRGKFEQAYGRFEARIKLPRGQGMWPAFWLLGNDIQRIGWPACGEIDVMENIGREPAMVHGSVHGPGFFGADSLHAAHGLSGDKQFADDFHLFAIEWEPREIRWYVDQQLYEIRTSAELPSNAKWVQNHPYYILLNLAVGGNWPGSPDESTVFPQALIVDYVRVYSAGPDGQVLKP